jgi:hypothetical protein
MGRFRQGYYVPTNPDKYIGKIDKIFYRSSWEYRVMLYMDISKSVSKWSSEELIINYVGVDNKPHRYFPDIYCELSDLRKYVIEIKPKKDTLLYSGDITTPKGQKRLAESVVTMETNRLKWEACKSWCAINNITFMVWTEDEIFGKGVKP